MTLYSDGIGTGELSNKSLDFQLAGKGQASMPTEGLQGSYVEKLRKNAEIAIDTMLATLRKLEAEGQQTLQRSTVEQQQLDVFLEEIHYRLQFLSMSNERGERPITVTGPLTDEQLGVIERREGTLLSRKGELQKTNEDLQQVVTRLSWLIHQIEGAGSWVLASPESAGDADVNGLQPGSGEQVLWAQIIMGQEAERARLAREIHDGPAQALANTVMRLQLVEQMFTHQPEQVEGELARLRTAVQESLRDVRRFLFDLRPASLSDVGLLPTLRYYVRDYAEQNGVEVELNLPESLSLSSDKELVIFRIVQEALHNIHKHADATLVTVDIRLRDGGPLMIRITDDGRGFHPQQVRHRKPSSSGLVNMRERAATVGGTLEIDSSPGVGSTVMLSLPMPKSSQEDRG